MTILLTWAASATIIAIEDMVLAQSNSSVAVMVRHQQNKKKLKLLLSSVINCYHDILV